MLTVSSHNAQSPREQVYDASQEPQFALKRLYAEEKWTVKKQELPAIRYCRNVAKKTFYFFTLKSILIFGGRPKPSNIFLEAFLMNYSGFLCILLANKTLRMETVI